jgi:hypothetical protein
MSTSSAVANIVFKNCGDSKLNIKNRADWFTITKNIEPNDWSIHIIFLEDVKNITNNFSVNAEIFFLMPKADYLLIPNTKFKLFTLGITKNVEADVTVTSIVKIL